MYVLENRDDFLLVLGAIAIMAALLMTLYEIRKNQAAGKKDTRARKYALLIVLLIVLSTLSDKYSTTKSIKENTRYFKDGDTLMCDFVSQKYLVSQIRGWKIQQNYFIKDDLLLEIHKCRISEISNNLKGGD